MRGVLVFFDLVEFISQSRHILSLDNLVDVLRSVNLFSVAVSFGKYLWIVSHAPVFLNLAWFIDVGLPIFLQMFWSGWSVFCEMHIWSYIKVCIFSFSDSNNLVTSCAKLRIWITDYPNTFFECLSEYSYHFYEFIISNFKFKLINPTCNVTIW